MFVHPPSETLFDCCVDLVPAAERALRGRKSSADIPAWRRPSFWSHCGQYTELPAADEADPLQGLRDEIFTVVGPSHTRKTESNCEFVLDNIVAVTRNLSLATEFCPGQNYDIVLPTSATEH